MADPLGLAAMQVTAARAAREELEDLTDLASSRAEPVARVAMVEMPVRGPRRREATVARAAMEAIRARARRPGRAARVVLVGMAVRPPPLLRAPAAGRAVTEERADLVCMLAMADPAKTVEMAEKPSRRQRIARWPRLLPPAATEETEEPEVTRQMGRAPAAMVEREAWGERVVGVTLHAIREVPPEEPEGEVATVATAPQASLAMAATVARVETAAHPVAMAVLLGPAAMVGTLRTTTPRAATAETGATVVMELRATFPRVVIQKPRIRMAEMDIRAVPAGRPEVLRAVLLRQGASTGTEAREATAGRAETVATPVRRAAQAASRARVVSPVTATLGRRRVPPKITRVLLLSARPRPLAGPGERGLMPPRALLAIAVSLALLLCGGGADDSSRVPRRDLVDSRDSTAREAATFARSGPVPEPQLRPPLRSAQRRHELRGARPSHRNGATGDTSTRPLRVASTSRASQRQRSDPVRLAVSNKQALTSATKNFWLLSPVTSPAVALLQPASGSSAEQQPQRGEVPIRVVNDIGEPVADVTIHVDAPGTEGDCEIVTDGDGFARGVQVARGYYSVVVRSAPRNVLLSTLDESGLPDKQHVAAFVSDGTEPAAGVELKLQRACKATIAIDPPLTLAGDAQHVGAGGPQLHCWVSVKMPSGALRRVTHQRWEVRNGVVRLRGLVPGSVRVWLDVDGYGAGHVSLECTPDQPAHGTVSLMRGESTLAIEIPEQRAEIRHLKVQRLSRSWDPAVIRSVSLYPGDSRPHIVLRGLLPGSYVAYFDATNSAGERVSVSRRLQIAPGQNMFNPTYRPVSSGQDDWTVHVRHQAWRKLGLGLPAHWPRVALEPTLGGDSSIGVWTVGVVGPGAVRVPGSEYRVLTWHHPATRTPSGDCYVETPFWPATDPASFTVPPLR